MITPADIQEIAGVVPNAVVTDFARTLGIEVSGSNGAMDVDMDGQKLAKAKGFDDIKKKVRQIVREGYSASQLLSQVGIGTFNKLDMSPLSTLTVSRPHR